MSEFITGIDVGNFDTKSPNTTVPSGYEEYDSIGFNASRDGYITYNGHCYVLTQNKRFPYEKDKTKNDHMFILTLISIAKEIEYQLSQKYVASDRKRELIMQGIKEINTIHLGVGLPPMHIAKLYEPVIAYYKDHFKDGVSFEYNDYKFEFSLGSLSLYPQNYAVISATKKVPDTIMGDYDDYYSVDFGGYTTDLVGIFNGQLDISQCDSLNTGILTMFDIIKQKTRNDKGIDLTDNLITTFLSGRKVTFNDELKEYINKNVEAWTHGVLNDLAQKGVSFELYPIIFMGGSSILLKKYIRSYPRLNEFCEFIEDPNANAKAYYKLKRHELKSR